MKCYSRAGEFSGVDCLGSWLAELQVAGANQPVVQLPSIFSWVPSIQAGVAVCEAKKLLYGFFDPSSAQSDSAVADLRRHGSSNL